MMTVEIVKSTKVKKIDLDKADVVRTMVRTTRSVPNPLVLNRSAVADAYT